MGQLKTRIAELKQALQQLVEHNVHNPDDDDHWSGVLFFCATDERTCTLVEQVEILASELFFEHPRQPFARLLRQALRLRRTRQPRVTTQPICKTMCPGDRSVECMKCR